ncbi:unnamed protein product [Ascophyllum nodosum]
MSSSTSNPNPHRARRYQLKDGTSSSGSAGRPRRDAQQSIKSPTGRNLAAAGPSVSTSAGSASNTTPTSTRPSPSPGSSTEGSVRRSSTQKRRNEIHTKRLRHSACAQARRHSQQPSAGEPFFSPADHRRTSGSDAGSAATLSGPEGAPRDPAATELAPDIVALIKR